MACKYCNRESSHEKSCPAYPGPTETERDAEAVEKFLDTRLETLLEQNFELFNEGNNGIVLRINVNEIPDDVKEELESRGISLDSEKSVAKVLKVYRPGMGKHEFDMQQRAYDVAQEHANDEDYANVPKPLFFRNLEISDDLKRKLERGSFGFTASSKVEMFMMNHVDGEDIATQMFREIIRTHPRARHLSETVDDLTFNELSAEVSRVLDYSIPGGKSRNEEERAFEERKVYDANAKRLYAYLDKAGLQIDSSVLEQIKNTMDAFHENGIAYRDGHVRNFMIEGDLFVRDDARKKPVVHIIDYGTAKEFDGKYSPDVYTDESGDGARLVSDEAILKELGPLTVPPGERATTEERAYAERLDKLGARIEKSGNAQWAAFAKRAENELGAWATSPDEAYKAYVTSPARSNMDQFLAALKNGPGDTEQKKTFLRVLMEKVPVGDKNNITRILKVM